MGLIVKNSYIVYGNRNENFIAGGKETFEEFVKRSFGIVNLFENKLVKGRCNCDGKKDSEADVILCSEKDAEKFMLSKEATEPHIILIGDKPTNSEDDKRNDKSTDRQKTESRCERQISNGSAGRSWWGLFKPRDEQNEESLDGKSDDESTDGQSDDESTDEQSDDESTDGQSDDESIDGQSDGESTDGQNIELTYEKRTEPQSKRQPSTDIAVKNLWNILKPIDEQNDQSSNRHSDEPTDGDNNESTDGQKIEPIFGQRTEPQSKRQSSTDIAVKNLWNILKPIDEQNNKSTNEHKIESGDEQRTEPQYKRQASNDVVVRNLWDIFKPTDEQNDKSVEEKSDKPEGKQQDKSTNEQKIESGDEQRTGPQSKHQASNLRDPPKFRDEQNDNSADEQNSKPTDEKSTDEKPTDRQKTEPQSKRQPSNLRDLPKFRDEQDDNSADKENNKPTDEKSTDEKSTDEKPTERQKTEPESKPQPSNDISAAAEKGEEFMESVNELEQSESQPKNVAVNVKQWEDLVGSLKELKQLKSQPATDIVVTAKQWEEVVGSVKALEHSMEAQRNMLRNNMGVAREGITYTFRNTRNDSVVSQHEFVVSGRTIRRTILVVLICLVMLIILVRGRRLKVFEPFVIYALPQLVLGVIFC